MADEDFKNRRRHQRVFFERVSAEDQSINGVKAIWLNDNRVAVFDISYSGAALEAPDSLDLEVGGIYPIKFEFESQQRCEMTAEVMWFNEKVVGVSFEVITTDTRLLLNEFLDDKLIGANLVEVNKDLFSSSMDCDQWFRGPKDTNVMFWLADGQLKQAVVEFYDHRKFVWENGQPSGGEDLYGRVVDILSQLPSHQEILAPLLTELRRQG